MAVQQGRRRVRTGGVPLGYVEDCDEPRTKLADFFSILLRLSLDQGSPLIADGQHDDSHDNHRQGEELAHRKRTENETEVGIRFTNEFYDHSTDAIAGDKAPEEGAWRRGGFGDDPYQSK